MLTGNQIGPRQFELPPNIPLSDSAGTYWTRYSLPAAVATYGWSACRRESERMPYGLRNSFSSSMMASTRRSLLSSMTEKRRRPRSEEHTSELQSRRDLVCRLLLEK